MAFYRDVLDEKNAVPPDAPEGTPPAWLYDDSGEAVVHLLPVDPIDPKAAYAKLNVFRGGPDKRLPCGFSGSGSIDHVALAWEDCDEVILRLKRHDVPYRENTFPV